ncbi:MULTISPECIES: helix-turn-helix transcriptional regulator [Sphingomonas]|nr:AlpA family phage regulatory protein [Sphingomonas paucimobilis]
MFEVKQRTGLSATSVYRKIAEGTFPPQVRFGPKMVAWYQSDIETFISARWVSGRKRLNGRVHKCGASNRRLLKCLMISGVSTSPIAPYSGVIVANAALSTSWSRRSGWPITRP